MQNNKKMWRTTFLLLAITLIGVFPLDVVLPSFPALADYFNASLEDLSLTLSIFAAGVAVAQLVLGPLSDVFGRRRLLVLGLLTAAAGAVGAAQAQSLVAFILFRFVQAMGCGCFVLVNAVIQDAYSAEARGRARIMTTTASGVFISLAPLAGVLLQSAMGWTASFWVFAGFTLGVSGLCVYWLPKRPLPARVPQKHSIGSFAKMFGNLRFAGYCALSGFGFACHFSFIVLSPELFLGTFGLTQYQYALVLLCYGAAYIAGGGIAVWMNTRLPTALQLRLGVLVITVAGVLLMLLNLLSLVSPTSMIACMVLCTCGVTIIRPVATTKALDVFPDRAGSASSLLNTTVFVLGGTISALLTSLPITAELGMAVTLITLGAVGWVISDKLGRVTSL